MCGHWKKLRKARAKNNRWTELHTELGYKPYLDTLSKKEMARLIARKKKEDLDYYLHIFYDVLRELNGGILCPKSTKLSLEEKQNINQRIVGKH